VANRPTAAAAADSCEQQQQQQLAHPAGVSWLEDLAEVERTFQLISGGAEEGRRQAYSAYHGFRTQ